MIFQEPPTIDFHYMGLIDFDLCVALQKRLVYEAQGSSSARIVCLLAEHPNMISIGRAGSRQHIRFTQAELGLRNLETRWIGRGGACVMHTPGQLAIYPIVPLEQYTWTVGDYLENLQKGLLDAIDSFGVHSETRSGRYGVWGKSGLLASIGASVQNWVTSHGAFLNVDSPEHLQSQVDSNPPELASPGDHSIMGSLVAENDKPARMVEVAKVVASHLAKTFECRYGDWQLNHPLLPEITEQTIERLARAY
ncbi:MAG: lipoyl protein ligase domain-containing protein [Pirellulales bacterium]